MRRVLLGVVLLCAAGAGTLWWLGYTVHVDAWPYVRPPAEQQAAAGAPGGGGRGGFGGGRRRGQQNPDQPVPVLAARAETRDVPIFLDGLGTVQAFNTVQVRAMVEGPLIEVRFKEGQDVKQGEVLAVIDPRSYQASLDSAAAKKQQDEANLANAKLDAARYAKLAATAFSSAQQADTSRAQVAQLEAQVRGDQAQIDTAKTQLSYTTIMAPFDGRVGIRQVDVGNIVRPGDSAPVTVLTQLRPISVVFTLPQQSLPAVAASMAEGVPEVLAMQAGPNSRPLDRGKLAVLDNQVDSATGTIKLKATFPNEGLKLWPGGFVNVRMLIETQRNVVTVPTSAVQRGPRGTYVFVISPDMSVKRTPVTVGHEDERASIVTAGLKSGDQVVVDGAQRLSDTSKVAVAGPDGTAPDAAPRGGVRRGPRSGGGGARHDGGPAHGPRMNISAPFIARPIATWLLAIAVLLTGVLGYRALPVSALPTVDFPTIQVTTQLPGAGPETVATLITASLERQFGQITGLSSMTSTSSEGTSQITLQFNLNRRMDSAAQDVQAAINASAGTLPATLPYPPVYAKVNPADAPILSIALTSETIPIDRISDAADTLLQPKFSQIDGVGKVTVQGGQRPAVRIRVDPARVAAYNLSLEDVRTAVAAANVNGAKGGFDGARQAYALGANDQLATPDAYRTLVIAWRNGAPVRLSDIGTVVGAVENTRVAGWYNGRPAVVLDIQRQPGANIVATVAALKEALPGLQRAIPAQVRMDIVTDRTETIRASVDDVQFTLALSIGLVVFVIYLFLRSARATLIPAIALPLSLVGTFGVMALCGYSLDNLSLMALTVATGFVVDDAIVMIENVVRFIEKGETPLAAAYKGAAQIGFTIVSLTVSLVAVFIPLLFMGGVVGRLFNEFAVVLSTSVVVSAVVSLTLTPMMCGRFLRAHEKPSRLTAWFERGFQASARFYRRTLLVSLRHQGATLLVALATLVGTVVLYVVVPKGFLPQQDTGVIVAVTEAAQSASIPRMQQLQTRLAEIARADPAVTGVTSFVGAGTINATPNTGRMTIALKPRRERDPAPVVIARLQRAMDGEPGMSVFMQPVQDIQIGARISRTQFQYTLMDTDAEELNTWAPRLLAKLRTLPDLKDVATDQQSEGFATRVEVDRDAAMRLGVSMQAVQDTLYDAFGQRQISTIFSQANQYRVVLESNLDWQADPNSLLRLRVPATGAAPASANSTANASSGGAGQPVSATGTPQVPLSAIATIVRETAPLAITHQAQFPAITISFNLAPGASLSHAVAAVAQAEAELGMPATIVGSYSGDAAEFQASLASEPWLILAAIVVIYIVLGVLYESTIHPVTILSTLPSAGIGALLALLLAGQDLSLVALVGIVLLMGIVKKNAIIMIDFAIEAVRDGGMTPRAAIEEACALRYRPIMMTTAAALLGALPLMLEDGTGSELRYPLGVTIVGGLLLSQVLTLYTTPVIYLYFERLRARFPRPAAVPAE